MKLSRTWAKREDIFEGWWGRVAATKVCGELDGRDGRLAGEGAPTEIGVISCTRVRV